MQVTNWVVGPTSSDAPQPWHATWRSSFIDRHYHDVGQIRKGGIWRRLVLLELARQLGATSGLRARVDLVAYSLEEPPFFGTMEMGSVHHARTLAREGARVRGMLGLEMIGYFSDAEDSQRYPSIALRPFYPNRGDFIAIVGREDDAALARMVKGAILGANAVPAYSMTGPLRLPGVDWSDHRSYWHEGISAVMITDTAFLRNMAYHTDGDRPELLDYRRMAGVVRGVYAAVIALTR